MFSTIALAKNSKFTGKIVGTHQRLDQAARRSLGQVLPKSKYFPSSKDIIHFEGSRGPDGLKRKSPGIDEPSHMLVEDRPTQTSASSTSSSLPAAAASAQPTREIASASPAAVDHSQLDARSVLEMIIDHHWNLVRALRRKDHIRAAFEAAWMAHMLTDGLTPAHHFPLSEVKDELMTDKEFVKLFGEPLKGVMHGRNMLETLRNNWLYWGAGGHMSKHIAYEYGVLMIAAALPPKSLTMSLSTQDLQELDTEQMFLAALERVRQLHIYDRFLESGWTTELAAETKDVLLPEIVRTITLGWYSAAAEAYHLNSAAKNHARRHSQPIVEHNSSNMSIAKKPSHAKK